MEEKIITAQRIADMLTAKGLAFEQKKMFGGICFLVDEKMLIGANRDNKLLARIDPAEEAALLARSAGISVMEHGSRLAHGYLYIEAPQFESDTELAFWLRKCLEYNPKAKASGKKK